MFTYYFPILYPCEVVKSKRKSFIFVCAGGGCALAECIIFFVEPFVRGT